MAAIELCKGIAGEPARTIELVANVPGPWYARSASCSPGYDVTRALCPTARMSLGE